jgi:hypothetical protein
LASVASRIVSPVAIVGSRSLLPLGAASDKEPSNSSSASSEPEAGDVRPRRSHAENQSGDGLPRRVPHSRYPAGTVYAFIRVALGAYHFR